MKIVCEKEDLSKAINIVNKAVPVRTTMTILECILIDARTGHITLTANDMELAIETTLTGTVEEKGLAALNAKMLAEIVRKLPSSLVMIETDADMNATITCSKSVYHIEGKDGDDFPRVPMIDRSNSLVISQVTLREMIRQTIFAISQNDTNPIMTG